jgi:hypothetical protein
VFGTPFNEKFHRCRNEKFHRCRNGGTSHRTAREIGLRHVNCEYVCKDVDEEGQQMVMVRTTRDVDRGWQFRSKTREVGERGGDEGIHRGASSRRR